MTPNVKASTLQNPVSNAFLEKARILKHLDRLPETVAVLDELIGLYSSGTTVNPIMATAMALITKGRALVELNRAQDALCVFEDIVQRYGDSDHSALQDIQDITKKSQLEMAQLHFAMGRGDASIAAVDLLLESDKHKLEVDCRGHLTRARAHLLGGNDAACVPDIEKALSILSGLDTLGPEILDDLCWLAAEFKPAQLRELILTSPASGRLLPLTTALERELKLETRVAREVEEMAEAIQRDLEERKTKVICEV